LIPPDRPTAGPDPPPQRAGGHPGPGGAAAGEGAGGHRDERIKTLTKDHDQDLANLDTIPGIGRRAAEIIIAETGGDMTTFATAAHLASWIGVSPGLNESAGVAKAGPTRGGNGNLKRVLGIAAMAAVKKKDSYYGVYYRRLPARRGRQRALVAVMRKLATAIWHILHHKVEHHDLGADYFATRDPQRAIKRMIREANALGMTVRFDPIPARRRQEGRPRRGTHLFSCQNRSATKHAPSA
jgi:hypothetical protein